MPDLIPGNLEHIDIFKRREQLDLRIKMLRAAGCECERPNIGWCFWGDVYGPVCHTCGTGGQGGYSQSVKETK